MHLNRRFTRHPVLLRVWLLVGRGWESYASADVSREGLFVCTPQPERHQEGKALQARVELPQGDVVEFVARVRRVVAAGPSGPGLGLEFFAIGDPARARWDGFVLSLRPRNTEPGYVEDSQNLRDLVPSRELREMLRKMREAGEVRGAPALSRPPERARPVVVPVQPTTREQLQALVERCARATTLFLRTSSPCAVGQPVHVLLVHPDTDEEWVVGAVVERVVTAEDDAYAGVQVRFAAMGEQERQDLGVFVQGARAA